MEKKEFRVSEVSCSAKPLRFDPALCNGCNNCADACQVDVLVYSTEHGKPPIIMYPGECWYCGACVMECPVPGAVRMQHPLMNRAKFIPIKENPEIK